jgi:hypothetical protein
VCLVSDERLVIPVASYKDRMEMDQFAVTKKNNTACTYPGFRNTKLASVTFIFY